MMFVQSVSRSGNWENINFWQQQQQKIDWMEMLTNVVFIANYIILWKATNTREVMEKVNKKEPFINAVGKYTRKCIHKLYVCLAVKEKSQPNCQHEIHKLSYGKNT